MRLARGPFIKKKTQGTEGSTAFSALYQAPGMGNRCGGQGVNGFTLRTACKHRFVVAKRGLTRLLALCRRLLTKRFSSGIGVQEIVTLNIGVETRANPVFPVAHDR